MFPPSFDDGEETQMGVHILIYPLKLLKAVQQESQKKKNLGQYNELKTLAEAQAVLQEVQAGGAKMKQPQT